MRAAILAATMLCGLATGAQADVVTYSTNVSATALAAILAEDRPTNLTPFDPTLGTLTAVSVELQGTLGFPPYTLTPSTTALPTSASVTPHLTAYPLASSLFNFATQTNRPVVNGQIIGLQQVSFDVTQSLPLGFAADPFLNLLPFSIISNANGNYDQATTGDADPTTLNGVARVSYTYDAVATASPVPEPASIALVGLGIAAFSAARRRSGAGRAA